jgi:hypothetical protein
MENTANLFDAYMVVVFTVMVSAGVLAGVANFFLAQATSSRELVKYVILGIVAALTVPLFLNMTSSNLLEFGRTRPLAVFVFAGFCLLYVLLSRRLFEAVANRLLQRAARAPVSPPLTVEEFFRVGLSPGDLEIMQAVARGGSVYDNLTTLSAKPPAKEVVNARLALLREMGLVELTTDEKNVMHLCLSPTGARLLGEVGSEQHA